MLPAELPSRPQERRRGVRFRKIPRRLTRFVVPPMTVVSPLNLLSLPSRVVRTGREGKGPGRVPRGRVLCPHFPFARVRADSFTSGRSQEARERRGLPLRLWTQSLPRWVSPSRAQSPPCPGTAWWGPRVAPFFTRELFASGHTSGQTTVVDAQEGRR